MSEPSSEPIELHNWVEFKKLTEATVLKKYYGKKTASEMDKLVLDCIYAKALELSNQSLRSIH